MGRRLLIEGVIERTGWAVQSRPAPKKRSEGPGNDLAGAFARAALFFGRGFSPPGCSVFSKF